MRRRYPRRVKRFRHTLGSLVGALLCLMALATTAAPVQAHTVSHWLTPVATGEHHHHHDDGSVTADHHHEQDDNAPDDQGHEHMTSAAALAMVPPVEAAPVGLPSMQRGAVLAVGDAGPSGLRPPPDDRPPRTI